MTETQNQTGGGAAAEGQEVSLLDSILDATKQTERDEAQDLVKNLVDNALKGVVQFDKNLSRTVNTAIERIDLLISKQLSEVMHHEKFQKLEGSWRGFHKLVHETETGTGMKIRVFNISKNELQKDLEKAVDFDQSQMFKKMYTSEFSVLGGAPYGAMIGDFEFGASPDDISILRKMSGICGASFCPFISAAGASMFGVDDMSKITGIRDINKVFESSEYVQWRSFRESEDSRFVALTMNRTLARMPYGESTRKVEEFNFQELETDEKGRIKATSPSNYTWMNPAYVMGTVLTRAFAQYGWCTAIRGVENGGEVTQLPTHSYVTSAGKEEVLCPTEVQLDDRLDASLSGCGFLGLYPRKNSDSAVFFSGQTVQKPKKYDDPSATANAEISARLPYIMATGRIAHYLKSMARDKIGSFMEADEAEVWLQSWINNYTNSADGASAEMKARYPLREARIEVFEVPGQPGVYNARAHLRPWLQMEELNASLSMVAELPAAAG